MKNTLRLFALLAVYTTTFGCANATSSTDGVTSWLRSCDSDAECGDDLACECGICSRNCEGADDCSGLADGVCLPQSTAGLACSSSSLSLCVAVCNENKDCQDLGRDARCEEGLCIRSSSSLISADGEPMSTSLASARDASSSSSLAENPANPEPTLDAGGQGDSESASTPESKATAQAFDAGSTDVGASPQLTPVPPQQDAQALDIPSDASSSAATEFTWEAALEACDTPRQSVYLAQSQAELETLLLGDWVACTAGGFQNENELGVRFKDDGTYDLLYLDGDKLVPGEDAAQRGIWQLGDGGTGEGDPAILVQSAAEPGSGYWVHVPAFSDNPRRWRIRPVFNGEEETEFVTLPAE